MAKIPYREAIGSLMYAAIATRPDISFAVSTLSQFLENPGESHWEAVKRVFRYLAGTSDFLARLGLKAGSTAQLLEASGLSNVKPVLVFKASEGLGLSRPASLGFPGLIRLMTKCLCVTRGHAG